MAFDIGINRFTFFDAFAVKKAVNAKTRSALSKFGAFVRTRAKSSIRKRKQISTPGQPPSSHVGTLKRLIFFGYDPLNQSVVVGPVKFGAGVAPRALEHSGPSMMMRGGEIKKFFVRQRPFMQPAMVAELPKFAALFRG